MEQNPDTLVISTTMTQAQFNTPVQPQKTPKTKGPLSRLFAALSLPKDQFKFKTPKNNLNEIVAREQTDFLVPPQNFESPEFIHDATFEENIGDNIQFNTYTKTHMEGKPHIPTTL